METRTQHLPQQPQPAASTTPTTTPAPTSGRASRPLLDPTSTHAHSSRCWWDHLRPGWVCAADGADAGAPPAAGSAPGGVDVRDMLVVHTAMLRELRLLPAAVRSVPDGDRRSARRVDGHLRLVAALLHHHHEGEDELLWPVLRPRLTDDEVDLLDLAEAQHVAIDQGLGVVEAARRAWVRTASTADRDHLADVLQELSELLVEHTEAEERQLLPLVAQRLTPAEWHAVGEAGAASVAKKDLPLVFGMFAYEGDPEVLTAMLASAPAVPRLVVPRIAPRLYARRAARVHGTRTP